MIIGLLRIKNEARWIERVVRSIQPVCRRILILDDHSTDGTPEICESLGCQPFRSPFDGIHEARDKDYLLEKAWETGAAVGDYCLMVDGDEALHWTTCPRFSPPRVQGQFAARRTSCTCGTARIRCGWIAGIGNSTGLRC